ncbi:MAG: transposase family protein [Phycisphaerales bacterium]
MSRFEPKNQKQEAAIIGLLSGQSVANIAKQHHLAERTLRRWLADPDFQRRLKAGKREARGRAMRLLNTVTIQAVTTLIELMTNKTSSDGIKLKAALGILTHAFKDEVADLADLHERLETLLEKYAK